jgi:signal transduction histidine kinase
MGGLAITGHAVARGLIKHGHRLDLKDQELVRLHGATKEHAQLLDTVLETVNVGVWAMDTNGADILTNRRLRADRSWVQESADALNPFTVVAGASDEDRNSPADLAVRGASFTNRLVRVGNGENQRTFSAAARPLLEEDGQLKGSIIAFTDVTALVKAQTARDKFVATISHELRTPLTSILGYLDILDDQPNPAFIGIIGRNAERLLTLVNDLLLVASEDLELRRRPTNVSELLQESVKNARPAAAARGITIAMQIHGDVAADVDPGQFSKAIDQLLSNAIKFSPEGTQVVIGLRGNNGEVVLSVRDHGIGMTEEEQDEAFTKFFRADRAMESAIPGAGLGLPLSKAIIEAHGGTIGLNSQPGSGTTVTVTVPR